MAVSEERAGEAVREQVGASATTPPLPFAVSGWPNEEAKLDWPSFVRSMVLGGAVALGAYLLISRFLPTVPRAHLGSVGKLVLFAGVLSAAAVAPLVHEVGHVIGGALVRFRFAFLAWGPFRVAREADHVRVRLNRDFALAGGIALSLPTTMEDLARRNAIVVAMGPAVSLVAGVVAMSVSYLTGIWRSSAAMSDPTLAITGMAAATFGLCSIGLGLLTLIPGRTGRFATDGAQLLRYVRGGAGADRHSAVVTLLAVAMGATRPRAWPRDLIHSLTTADPGGSDAILGESFAYYQALDDGDVSRAHQALSTVLERTIVKGRRARAPYAQEAAFYELAVRGDASAAGRWLDEELGGSIADVPMRKVLVELLTLTKVVEAGDATAAAKARSRIEEALPALAARSGVDALKAELVARRLAELRVA